MEAILISHLQSQEAVALIDSPNWQIVCKRLEFIGVSKGSISSSSFQCGVITYEKNNAVATCHETGSSLYFSNGCLMHVECTIPHCNARMYIEPPPSYVRLELNKTKNNTFYLSISYEMSAFIAAVQSSESLPQYHHAYLQLLANNPKNFKPLPRVPSGEWNEAGTGRFLNPKPPFSYKSLIGTKNRESIVVHGFKGILYSHQEEALRWIHRLESKPKPLTFFGEKTAMHLYRWRLPGVSPTRWLWFDAKTGVSSICKPDHCPSTIFTKSLTVRGGILTDPVGAGKTVTFIAQCLSDSFATETYRQFIESHRIAHPANIPTLATLIVVPTGMVAEWKQAFLTHTNLSIGTDVLCIDKMPDALQITYKMILNAKVVLVNAKYLGGVNYFCGKPNNISHTTKHNWYHQTVQAEMTRSPALFLNTQAILHSIYWRRIVTDEIHTIKSDRTALRPAMKAMKAYCYWGITATPNIESCHDAADYLHYLMPNQSSHFVTDIQSNHYDAKRLLDLHLRSFVARKQLVAALPELEHSTQMLVMTREENALYQLSDSEQTRLASCSHFALGAELSNIYSNLSNVPDIHTFAHQMEVKRKNELDTLGRSIAKCADATEISKLHATKRSIESQLRFFDAAMKELRNNAQHKCLVCLEEYGNMSKLAIATCGHYICIECLRYAKDILCAVCRQPAKYVTTRLDNISVVGTKLNQVLQDVRAIMEADHTNRILIFTEYNGLAKYIQKDLTTAQIGSGHVDGSSAHRANIMKGWGAQKPILILTVQDSSAGLNLQAANHVLFVNPLRKADELQAIGRCHRQGQTRKVFVKRYVMKDTIEERRYQANQATNKRNYAQSQE